MTDECLECAARKCGLGADAGKIGRRDAGARPAPVGVGPQEVGELALGQQDHLAELGHAQTDQPAEELARLVEPGAHRQKVARDELLHENP